MKIEKQFKIKGIRFDKKPICSYFNYGEAIEYAKSVGKELISERDMEMLLLLPRKLTKDTLYIAEKDIWLDDPNRRIELPKLGYYDQSSSIERLTLYKVEGCYWLQNTNPKPTTGNQPYLCFKNENRIMIYYSVPSYGQPILLKTP